MYGAQRKSNNFYFYLLTIGGQIGGDVRNILNNVQFDGTLTTASAISSSGNATYRVYRVRGGDFTQILQTTIDATGVNTDFADRTFLTGDSFHLEWISGVCVDPAIQLNYERGR